MLLIFTSLQCGAEPSALNKYLQMASDQNISMSKRWGALLKAAESADTSHVAQIRKFISSQEWYMRNAALIALAKISPEVAKEEAKKLLFDKALVVRSAAVDVIAKNLTPDSKKILETEINKSYNFHKKSSLWIRKQIMQKLSASAEKNDRDFFVKILFDTDEEISLISTQALQKITGHVVEGPNVIEKWKLFVKEKQWL